MKKLTTTALAILAMLATPAMADHKDSFKVAWSIYVGWMPWGYIEESGIMDKWADKYGIDVEIVQINDYIESINQYTAGAFDGVSATNMDTLSIPSGGGVDTTALIVGDYSNGNDAIILKGDGSLEDLAGKPVNLVELSVSHYLLAQALDSVGMSERDVQVVNTSDADLVAAFSTDDVRNVVTWNPLLDEVAAMPDAHKAFDSSNIPGHIKDLTIVNSETLADNPDFGKALVGAWYEVMGILESDTEEGAKARAALGQASGTDQAGYESQLKGMKMFWTPTDSLTFIQSDEAYQAMDSVRQFSFDHGLLGDGADSVDFVGIAMPGDTLLGSESNVKLHFDTTYMQMAADGKL